MADQKNADLPLDIVQRDTGEPTARRRVRFRKRFLMILLVPVIMFIGAVVGMYFQPPGLQHFYALSGLQPGAGAKNPIALPPEISLPPEMEQTMQITDVVGLARLMPFGDVSIVAPPYGSGDARIAEILVSVGERVEKDSLIARLDNQSQLESAVLLAKANVAVKQAALAQTQAAVQNSRDEAQAGLDQARSVATEASAEYLRTQELFARGVATKAVLERVAATEQQAILAVEKSQATLARFTSEAVDAQPDVIVAARNVDAANADFARAERDLARATVSAPITGVVLDIHARAGERSPNAGILEMGDTSRMMAEVEIYQDRIISVAPGQPVELAAKAIGQTLQGRVDTIGLTVGRQGLMSDDTAANADARVVTVLVALDAASSAIAARFTNLEVIARIDTSTTLQAGQ